MDLPCGLVHILTVLCISINIFFCKLHENTRRIGVYLNEWPIKATRIELTFNIYNLLIKTADLSNENDLSIIVGGKQ